ncbi:phosphohistidine phosphatase, SixA [Methylophilaceae bacterium 11]|nr:phosphohistidine phosphatase, SixA [Methylophilaceae bacterium 11]
MPDTQLVKNVILWRHADAELCAPGQTDMARPLTAKGLKQSRAMAQWLQQYLPKNTVVLVSPALRALQTAEALNGKVIIEDVFQPDTRLTEVLAYLHQHTAENVLIVGHQPWLGELVAALLCLGDTPAVSVKKGAVWWLRLRQQGGSTYQLFSVQTPQLLD